MEKDCKNIWSKCLLLIKQQVMPEKFRTLFEPIRALKFKNDVLTIQVASAYVYEALEGEFIDILKNALKAVIGPNAKAFDDNSCFQSREETRCQYRIF